MNEILHKPSIGISGSYGMAGFFKKIKNRLNVEREIIFGAKSKDKEYISKNKYDSEQEAKDAFRRSVKKLLDVERWSELPGISSKFELYNSDGSKKESEGPTVGDHLRIMIPGPMPENWVEVVDIVKEKDKVSFTVSPDLDPQERGEEDVEHFFSKEASSKFQVERKGKVIYGAEIGKNEGINNKGKDAGNRKVLNTVVAETGWLAFQKLQWRKLTNYLVHKIELDD